ncbi:hypothetical protein [Nocardia arthritidis]|uniref:Uncharacterized protein n=1 Tax=Nocardia arthritidis TaxID=228602 RepID=A0A6G9YT28_9NOCA|nr:hypothetical protein [Nocardia arthritidis]QIS16475.1 hypothetical protein F5544_43340 [Nocardia arthritidis]
MNIEAANEMRIPDDIESAVLDLKGLGELVTATEWQRAALVFAFTYEGRPGGRSTGQESPVAKSIDEFAKLALAGLKSRNSVRKYRRAWALAIQDGYATHVMPGDIIALPEVDWDEYINPPKASRKPSEPRKGRATGSADNRASKSESEGLSAESDSSLDDDIDLDATKPGNKRARKALLIAEGIETKRLPERFKGGVTRIKDALIGFGQPGANHETLYLYMCQALGDLATVLEEEPTKK